MTADEYVARREARGGSVRRVQDGHMVTCPAHDDRTPSLHVSAGNDGRVLLRCQAGCEQDAVVAADELTMADLFPERGNGHREIAATYPYIDENDDLLFEVVRFAPKGFGQRRPDGRGGWVWKLGDTRRVPYRLPKVLDAVANGRTVFVAEGEKDVHALERAGAVATCNPQGAGKWRDEYSAALRGADVVIVADRDDRGREHARQVFASLQGIAKSVLVVQAATGKDAYDHLNAGHGLNELVDADLADGVPPSQPPIGSETVGQARARHRFTTRGVDLAQLRPVRFAWKPWLIQGRLNLLAGEEAAGKSTLQGWLAAKATRGSLEGGLSGRPARLLWVGADEDDWFEVVTPRLYAAGADLSMVREFVPVADDAIFNVHDHIGELARELRDGDFDLVVFEQLLDVMPPMKNPNDPMELRRALRPLRRALAACDVTGLGTLHVNKAEADKLRQRMQGSMQFGALSRSTTLVDRHPSEPDRRIAVLGKANYVAGSVAMSFVIESHGFDLNGREFDVGRVADVQRDEATIEDVLGQGRRRARERDEHRDDVIDLLDREGPLSVRAVGDALDLSRSTAHRLLRDLKASGLVEQADDGWVSHVPSLYREVGHGTGAQSAIFDFDGGDQ
jgi:hypothetical protein